MTLLVGSDDDEMYADAYALMLRSLRPDIAVQVVPGVGHIGIASDAPAPAAIRAVFAGGARVAR